MANTILYQSTGAPTNAMVTVIEPDGSACSHVITDTVVIGRNANDSDCNITINSPIVSRVHGEFYIVDGAFYYRDMGSTNGTYINNNLIGKNNKNGAFAAKLNDGDIIRIDIISNGEHHNDCVLILFTVSALPKSECKKIEFRTDIAEIQIGRSASSGVSIQDNTVSEKHASFFCSQNGWAIIDHKSTNGVYLNTKRLGSPRYLKKYDVIRICNVFFVFLGDCLLYLQSADNGFDTDDIHDVTECKARGVSVPFDESQLYQQSSESPYSASQSSLFEPPKLVINIIERSVVQRFKRLMLLQNINISVSGGEMVLILGGSGAGKTTFINAVMGYEKANGKIIYDDTDIYEEYELMKYEIGFVPQQDLLRGGDTVYDTLSNAAQMKLPSSYSDNKRENMISDVLDQFGLIREKNSLVSKLSGGQKKRLSIAVEFISNPSLFFLDEPDSGIDDIMGRGIMEKLRDIADMGKIVMVITHSPQRAADLFDKVIVLAKSTKDNCGHLAFFGGVDEAYRFFDVDSFSGIVKKINRKDENGDGLSDYYIDKYSVYSGGKV